MINISEKINSASGRRVYIPGHFPKRQTMVKISLQPRNTRTVVAVCLRAKLDHLAKCVGVLMS